MKNLVTICARGGSKGIPGKNIKLLNNKPLIYYTLRIAEEFASYYPNTHIFLSTDSDEIKKTVKEMDFETVNLDYERPEELATDSSGKIGVIKDVLQYAEATNNIQYDNVLDLDVTSPLRDLDDLNAAFKQLYEDPEAYNLISVNPANRNPYFNMVEKKENSNYIKLCKEGSFLTRQSAPDVYDVNASFYFYKKKFFRENCPSPITAATLVYVMPHICFDLDHPIDFDFMSFLLEKKKLDFKFLV